MRILIVEDEPALRRQLAGELQRLGYRVDATGEGKEALYFASEYPFDAAVVDLGLPGMSGLEVIGELRKRGSTLPILILTARDRWSDKVAGMDAGADDYLAKPFHMEELLARVRAQVRRASGHAKSVLRCGPVEIDLAAQTVRLNADEVDLTTFEYRLLEHLARERPRVVGKDELAAHLYPHDEERDSNVIEVLIGRLRRKLDPHGTLKPLETLRGRGYRFTLGDG